MDWIRPSDVDGSLVGAVFSTYGLALDQPDFFGQDFLPTLLGLGGVRARGYASPVTLDRVLATADVSLICDAHAVAPGVRPTLRIDVLPIGHKVHHAKVMLIHRQNRVRLLVGSANLTHEGFRRQRESAVVMDFYEGCRLPLSILKNAVARWAEVLGDSADEQVHRVFDGVSRQADAWSASSRFQAASDISVVFGGDEKPLWRQFVDAWPQGEPVLNWHICSPSWPQVDRSASRNPFEAIANALRDRGSSLANCDLEIIACADSPGPNALPQFPFALLNHLREQSFPIQHGRILPARLEAAKDEIPAGMAGENRALHAKWIVLAGPATVVAMMGSANFTRRGLGVLRNLDAANIEAGVIMRWPRGKWHPKEWRPPIQGQEIDWATCSVACLKDPPSEEEKVSDWPDFIRRIELAIYWDHLPDPDGRLFVYFRAGNVTDFSLTFPSLSASNQSPVIHGSVSTAYDPFSTAVSASNVRAMLARRVVEVVWARNKRRSLFPVNVLHESKAGMPSVLGARPSEEELLAYFHGSISEEDLLFRLEQQAREGDGNGKPPVPEDVDRIRRLQNYIVREFVEGLYGLSRMIQESSYSPRAAEQAILGDFSPTCLAEQIVHAFTVGKRTPAAAAFQLVELLRVIADLDWPSAGVISSETRAALEDIRRRGVDRLFALAAQANAKAEFAQVVSDRDFTAFVRATLPPSLVCRWTNLAPASPATTIVASEEGVS